MDARASRYTMMKASKNPVTPVAAFSMRQGRKRNPVRGQLAWFLCRVCVEKRDQRAIIRPIHADGIEQRFAHFTLEF
jgi:hypothetical protein